MLDDFPDDLRPVVHNHWGKFPPQHPLVKDAFGLLFGMLFVVAFLGNSCVIYVFAGTKRLRTPVRFAEQKTMVPDQTLPAHARAGICMQLIIYPLDMYQLTIKIVDI